MINLNELAKKFIEGEWLFNADDKILKKTFATNKELSELHLIDKDGYLDSGLKNAILQALGETILSQAIGPFNDNDIFSGDVLDDGILYNLEMHQVSDLTINELKKIPNIIIKPIK